MRRNPPRLNERSSTGPGCARSRLADEATDVLQRDPEIVVDPALGELTGCLVELLTDVLRPVDDEQRSEQGFRNPQPRPVPCERGLLVRFEEPSFHRADHDVADRPIPGQPSDAQKEMQQIVQRQTFPRAVVPIDDAGERQGSRVQQHVIDVQVTVSPHQREVSTTKCIRQMAVDLLQPVGASTDMSLHRVEPGPETLLDEPLIHPRAPIHPIQRSQ